MRILLCDDDPSILSQMEGMVKEYFQERGLSQPEIASYTDGEQLLKSQDTGEIAFFGCGDARTERNSYRGTAEKEKSPDEDFYSHLLHGLSGRSHEISRVPLPLKTD